MPTSRWSRPHVRPALAAALAPLLAALLASAPSNASAQTGGGPFLSRDPRPLAGVRQVTLARGLEHPWGLAFLPDGALLVTERPGRLRIVRNGAVDPQPVDGVPPVLAEGQGGLLDVALHPRFAENRLVYLSYAHGSEEENRTRVARGVLDGKALRDVRVIFEVKDPKPGVQHFGSRFAWLPDGTLLVSIGDGGNPPARVAGRPSRDLAQDVAFHHGKVVRIGDDGSVPKDNPFAGRAGAAPAVWSYGHRNIQGLAVDGRGRVWSTEHGSRGGDEVNLLQAGRNYGWPVVSHSSEYWGGRVAPETRRAGVEDPLLVWTPSVAPSGLAVYEGDRFPAWKGDLLAGALRDRDVRRVDLDAGGKVVGEEVLEIGARVRDVRVGPDGLVYVLTDEDDGRIIRLEPG
jgi:glucose/arabinose dehydrogenase